MAIWILILLNLPVYLLIAWVVFDTKDAAADTFFETIVALLKIIFVPPIVRYMLGWDDEGAFGIFPIFGFFFACAGAVYGEYRLIQHFWPGLIGA